MNFIKSFIDALMRPKQNSGLIEIYSVPEPTKKLLFITNEDTSKIQSANSLSITITISTSGAKSEMQDGKNMYGEPSMIWTKLPIQPTNVLKQESMYFPSYASLTPECRYQYLMWLKDVTKPTNMSYVFLYYYGLERHLLMGEFDLAFQEILRLLKFHDKSTFRSYAETALIVSAIYRQKFDLIKQNECLYDGVSNEELIIRKFLGVDLNPKDIMNLASLVGLKNKRYIKLYPRDFESELEKVLVQYEYSNGKILGSIEMQNLQKKEVITFANYSLKENMRLISIPNIVENLQFKNILLRLLESAHENLKNRRNI